MKFFFSTFLLLFVVFQHPASAQSSVPEERPQNIIFMIPDGFGPVLETMARDFSGRPLRMDEMVVGSVHTRSANARITDSAAAGSALATGVMTNNGFIAMDSLEQPVATTIQAAVEKGMATGIVVTCRITHATPASFSAHVRSRGMENDIAAQQLQQGIDLMLGGGIRQFIPQSAEGSSRRDERNLIEEAEEAGYHYFDTRQAFDELDTLPALGLFNINHLEFEIDRDPEAEPGLAEMVEKAIGLLDGRENGFFLMVEGARIDHAAHMNDPIGTVHDVLAYDDAVGVALDFARRNGRTLVVSVSDHETGGAALGRDIDGRVEYNWYPDIVRKATKSAFRMTEIIGDGGDVREVVERYTGLDDITDEEIAMVAAEEPRTWEMAEMIGEIVSRRARIGWSTVGHSAVDVTLHAFGPGSEAFRGHMPNWRVGQIVFELMSVDREALTEQIRERMTAVVEVE